MAIFNRIGFTLIEVVVAIFLISIVFLGIFAAYQLGLQVVGYSKNRVIATSIANAELEKIRNLPYESIGVTGSFPEGPLLKESEVIQNNITFKIERRVDFVIDEADGIAPPEDDCPQDYKKAEVKVSSLGKFSVDVLMVTDISPKNLAQECAERGGILSVTVFDALGTAVVSSLIEIKDPATDAVLKTAFPIDGRHFFSLEPDTYKVVVSKSGYSQERTYGTNEIAQPERPHPIVLEGELTETSFSIDRLSSFQVETVSTFGVGSFADSFNDDTRIDGLSNVTLENGEVRFKIKNPDPVEYETSGSVISDEIFPDNLGTWEEFSWEDSEPPNTEIRYQLLFGGSPIPNADLPGNEEGFTNPPIDISGLSTTTYYRIQPKANFSSSDSSVTPRLFSWLVSWGTDEATAVGITTFNLRGNKIIGTNASEEPGYKYSQNHTSDSQGRVTISNLEWDNYTFSEVSPPDLNLVETNPTPQPIALAPNTTVNVQLFFSAQNSLLVTVKDSKTLQPIFSAEVRLYNIGLGYDKTQFTDENGKTYFIPLQGATYNLNVSAAGYSSASGQVFVSGQTTRTMQLQQIE